MAIHNEIELETSICDYLSQHGWLYSPDDTGYDAQLALFPDDVHAWLSQNQPEDYAQVVRPEATPAVQQAQREQLEKRLAAVLSKPLGDAGGGTLAVLRRGFRIDTSTTLRMAEPRPATDLNPAAAEAYARMRLRVMRQVYFDPRSGESVDLVLFLNGIPVATIELKTDATQSVGLAKKQYRLRNPKASPLFGFGTRALVHFAVSNREVFMTTKLAGKDTAFLPFNRGDNGHAGNPVNPHGSASAYLWEQILQRDTWLEILQKFVFVRTDKVETPGGRARTKHTLIFPRYHQWDAVTQMLRDVHTLGAGQSYLIEHSAGSGKTNTIAWTAHRLLSAHGADNTKIFDSVIVVTDRTVLDDQLQSAVRQLERTTGTVVGIDRKRLDQDTSSKSALLKKTLLEGNRIIVVTLQTFPAVLDILKGDSTLSGRRYAVIADEAHSSQTGASASKLKQVLTPAEQADLADGGEVDTEAVLAAEVGATGRPEHISFFAFTATPKDKTVELFGRPQHDQVDEAGRPIPTAFHRYTMQQAIEEGFILDVLKNFTNYDTAFTLARKGRNGEFEPGESREVDQSEASKTLMRWVKLHPTNISQKVEIVVEHFRENVAHLLDGTAKAMVVTDSRAAAVRYKTLMDRYITRCRYTDLGTLVAFSGDITDPEYGLEKVTEHSMNPGAGSDLARTFDGPGYQVMIVANKFQTGFDQPKLCALYVDKQLDGVLAVQTLSRLNRSAPGKDTTYVLDFVNSEETIEKAFKPYYDGADLEKVTDPNLLHDLADKLDDAGIYNAEDVDAFADVYAHHKPGQGQEKYMAILQPIAYRFQDEHHAAAARTDRDRLDELEIIRKDMSSYVKLYDFLAQIYAFADTDHHRRSIFLRELVKLLRIESSGEFVDISDVELVTITQQNRGTADITLTEKAKLRGIGAIGGARVREKKRGPIDEVIDRLNELFSDLGLDVSRDDGELWYHGIVRKLLEDPMLRGQASANSLEQFLTSPQLHRLVLSAVYASAEAHEKMSAIATRGGDPQREIIDLFGRGFFETVRGGGNDVGLTQPMPSDYAVTGRATPTHPDADRHAPRTQEEPTRAE